MKHRTNSRAKSSQFNSFLLLGLSSRRECMGVKRSSLRGFGQVPHSLGLLLRFGVRRFTHVLHVVAFHVLHVVAFHVLHVVVLF